MIEISHLTKKYGDHVAVDDLTLNIESGKIYGFLGPNGAGKSTTMNMITGYIAATEGSVKVNGFDILKQPEEARKCIGYLPELPPLYVDMTAWEYLKFAADLKKIPKDKKRQYIEEAMELTKITDIKNRLIRNLSKGYRQRVGLAQAVLGYPRVIILDEPTVGLDPKQMIEIRELIRSLGKRHTVILSSHILSEVKEVCEHIFIISKGRLAASDTTRNLTARTSGEQEIRLLLKGKKQEIMDALQKSEDLMAVSLAHDSEDGCFQAVLKGAKGEDIREQVFYTFAGAGIPILEMSVGSKSLEQVFLELTNQTMLADTAAEEAENGETEPVKKETEETGSREAESETNGTEKTGSGKTGSADAETEEAESGKTEPLMNKTAESNSRETESETKETEKTGSGKTGLMDAEAEEAENGETEPVKKETEETGSGETESETEETEKTGSRKSGPADVETEVEAAARKQDLGIQETGRAGSKKEAVPEKDPAAGRQEAD